MQQTALSVIVEVIASEACLSAHGVLGLSTITSRVLRAVEVLGRNLGDPTATVVLRLSRQATMFHAIAASSISSYLRVSELRVSEVRVPGDLTRARSLRTPTVRSTQRFATG